MVRGRAWPSAVCRLLHRPERPQRQEQAPHTTEPRRRAADFRRGSHHRELLTADVADSELQVGWPTHSWFRRDRDGHGGGVAAAVRTSLRPTRRTDLEPPDCELLAVQLCAGSPVIVAVCYRPPAADTQVQTIIDFAARVRQLGHPLLLVGDFNLPEIRWPQHETAGPGSAAAARGDVCGWCKRPWPGPDCA